MNFEQMQENTVSCGGDEKGAKTNLKDKMQEKCRKTV